MSSKYKVKKCICHERTFEEIKTYAETNGYSKVEQLQNDEYCSCQCGLCAPYVELMLKTGETVFEPGAYLQHN